MKRLSNAKYIILLLLSALFTLVLSNYSSYHKLKNALDVSNDYKFKYELYKDSLGREHAKFKVEPHHLNELNPEDRALVNEQSKALGVKPENIKQTTKVSTETKAPFHISTDTPSFNDGHLSIDVHKKDDSLVGTYTYRDTAWFSTYTKPKKFLGITYSSPTYGDVHFGNPNTRITGLQSISIDKYVRPKHWSIGPTLGVTYIDKWRPYIGFGITYSLIKF